mgnify:CR=1 FL=1
MINFNFNWSIHLSARIAVHHLGYTVHQISLYGNDRLQQSLFIAYCKAVQYFCYSSHRCSGMVTMNFIDGKVLDFLFRGERDGSHL